MSDTEVENVEEKIIKTVVISKEIYDEMVEDLQLLEALRAAGVDNWDGYDYAIKIYNEREEEYGN